MSKIFISAIDEAPSSQKGHLIVKWDTVTREFRWNEVLQSEFKHSVITEKLIMDIDEILKSKPYYKKINNRKRFLPCAIVLTLFLFFFSIFINGITTQSLRGTFLLGFLSVVGTIIMLLLACNFLLFFPDMNKENHEIVLSNREYHFNNVFNSMVVDIELSKIVQFRSGRYGAWLEILVNEEEKQEELDDGNLAKGELGKVEDIPVDHHNDFLVKDEKREREPIPDMNYPEETDQNQNAQGNRNVYVERNNRDSKIPHAGSIGNTGNLTHLPTIGNPTLPYRPPILLEDKDEQQSGVKLPPLVNINIDN